MLGQTWYNEHIKRLVSIFGTLFNNLHVQRKDNSGVVAKDIRVPLSYGPKQKWLTRLEQDAEANRQTEISLPRMGFELTGLSYASGRKLATVNQNYKASNNRDNIISQYNPVPYDFSFDLWIMSKNMDDGLMILEQIVPYFTPQFTITIKENTDLDISKDVPIILKSITPQDNYEGTLEDRRILIWDLKFTVESHLYPPVKDSKIIKKAIVNTIVDTTVPGAAGKQYYSVAVNPSTAGVNDNYTLIETFIVDDTNSSAIVVNPPSQNGGVTSPPSPGTSIVTTLKLSDLIDVVAPSPLDGSLLIYDISTLKWYASNEISNQTVDGGNF